MNIYDEFIDRQKQADKQRLKKCIAELEVTARHFKVGKVWTLVIEARNELQQALNEI